jgi:hypothetical protein
MASHYRRLVDLQRGDALQIAAALDYELRAGYDWPQYPRAITRD